ncbi:MAG: ABC transporter substrate-binding protein [Candidatus Methylacidiphilales bacterium]|nr:extracellular solute-binding protein [Candidatus Methylacidiphilales bacterium]
MNDIDDNGVSAEKKLSPLMASLELLNAWLPWIVIALAFGWSSYVVGVRQFKKVVSDKTVVRIAHWQLEQGVRDGINEAAAEYEKMHPNVKIAQEAIPESTYGQWLTVQLLGDNAPDIVEVGMVSENVKTTIQLRYLMALTPYVTQPNPYNKGTELEGVPLQQTFLDGMQNSYVDEAQEYQTITLARMGVRLVYNKTLLKQLTGIDTPPTNYREFLKLCEKIQKHKMPNGLRYSAICCSSYHYGSWNTNLIMPLTYPAFRDIDFNRDGRFSRDEWAIGFMTGKIDFHHPAYVAAFTVMKELRQYFQPGWVGLNRDEAIFGFAQEKGVFLPCGLWEAGGIKTLAEGKFELGIMDFPVLDKTDPEFGTVAEGARFENPAGTIPFAITRGSKNPEIALDFLLFLASQKQNEKFNARLNWLPIIAGAKMLPELKPFEPNLKGVFSSFEPALAGEITIKWAQIFALYQVNQLSYEELGTQFREYYQTKGIEDFEEFQRNVRRPQIRNEQLSTGLRTRAMLTADPNRAAMDWIKYRNIVFRTLSSDGTYVTYGRALKQPELYYEQQIYKYTPEALQRIRDKVSKTPVAPTPSAPSAPAVSPASDAAPPPTPSSAPATEPAPATPAPASSPVPTSPAAADPAPSSASPSPSSPTP